ncbi:MAG: hypothetical protein A3F73_10405 [Gallionellales bacterium RIFCSPLOWO2_12_FULL_59_22]|nr:MAG: hypothetical protein A3F73_10405 [Gallionellales bacterium RIFCSPLOWO2_12_FULL_59_22]
MSSGESLGWESLLQSGAPEGCTLQAALFTTYDRADERFLVENLLPVLLKLNHEPDGEGTERSCFLLKLDDCLKKLHGRIVVVSSTLREESSEEAAAVSDGMYGWIWRSIRHLTVGKNNKAVQHAKLWLLHWAKNGNEYIEIIISSANLTNSAFKRQIQAAWRVSLPLQPQASKTRLSSWGVFPGFMRELAVSCGDDSHVGRFIDLLARADCPQGITFVASVPGKHSQREQWGAAGLRNIIPAVRGAVSASVLSPFVGSWSEDALHQWCAHFEGKPDRISLVWIDINHPWVKNWLLPASTLNNLIAAGSSLLQLRYEPNDNKQTDHFHDDHQTGDDRWSHAKVYAFKRGNSRRLLLTSANFSKAAWGEEVRSGELNIENFELGVCVEQAAWPFEHLTEFEDSQDAATSTDKLRRSSRLISWAEATWDGKVILVECKSERDVTGQVMSRNKPLTITKWKTGADGLRVAQIRWLDAKRQPASVLLRCESEELIKDVFDARRLAERESSFPDEIDESEVQTIRDKLLIEQYGGKAVTDADADSDLIVAGENQDMEEYAKEQSGQADSYSVEAFVIARQHLQVVDNWAGQVTLAKHGSNEFVLEILQRDGRLLMAAFNRQAERNGSDETGARLAAEELALRLKHDA